MPEIEVTAKGNIAGGVQALQKVQEELGKTAIAATKMDSSLDHVSKTLNTGLKTGANQATGAMINLGRVIQDAPFGIIGITNNINPLLESFQRLKAETGSTGGALKALGSSLLGGGGLGLAISVVTSLMTLFALHNQGATKTLTDQEKALEASKKKIKEYKDALDDIIKSGAQEATQVLSFIAVLNNENESRTRQLDALQQLKKIQPEIFGNLKLEEGAVIGLTDAYQKYIANFKTVIAAKLIQIEIEKKLTQILESQGITQTEQNRKATESLRKYADSLQEVNNKLLAQNGALDITKKGSNFSFFQKQDIQVKVLNKDVEDLVKRLSELSKGITVDPIKDVKVKEIKVHGDIKFKPDKITLFDEENFPFKIQGLFKKFFSGTNVFDIPVDPEFQLNPTATVNSMEATRDEMVRYLKSAGIKTGLQGGLQVEIDGLRFPELLALYNSFKEKVDTFQKMVKDTIKNIQVDTFSGIGEAIGNALAGEKNPVQNLFGGLMKSIGEQVQNLGKFLIASAITVKLAKEAFKKLLANPIAAIAVGIGLVALGALLKAEAAKKYQGFASGTTNFSGGSALVGERGPERIFLPRGSSVQPNNELNAYGGGNMVFIPEVVLRGPDIVIAFNRASAAMGRNN